MIKYANGGGFPERRRCPLMDVRQGNNIELREDFLNDLTPRR